MRYGLCLLACLSAAPPVQALSLSMGGLEGQLDTRLSWDWRWATERPDSAWISRSQGGHGQQASSDDGRLNFRRGDSISRRLEVQQDLELRNQNSGLFVQARSWYDFELQDSSHSHRDLENGRRPVAAQSAGMQWRQAFLFHHYQWHEQPGTLRLGRQNIRWGEGALLNSALDVINPYDYNRFSGPEPIARDDRVPVSLLYLSQSLHPRWMLDAFYQLQAAEDVAANCGSFFATRDVLTEGCDRYALREPSQGEGLWLTRASDRKAKAAGQFGLALFWQGDQTRLGLHLLRYHSRRGVLGVRATDEPLTAHSEHERLAQGRYFLAYPEAIRLYGLTLSSRLPAAGEAWASLSYQPNTPLQRNEAELVAALEQNQQSGWVASGYQRKAVAQWQMGLNQPLGALAGARQLRLEAELGYIRVMGLGTEHHGRDPVFGTQGGRGFITSESWGYRLRLSADYRTPVASLSLQPRLVYAQDVQGYAPEGQFSQGARAVTLGLGLTYQDSYRMDMAYSGFYGGHYNPLADRDFMRLSLSMRF